MHVAIYKKGSDKIKYFVNNCIRKGAVFCGDNVKVHINLKLYDIMWTDDIVNPIMNGNEVVDWDKNVSDLVPSTDTAEVKQPSKSDFIVAMKLRKLIDNLTYQELETYIENNVTDLASAKEFLKTLSKVTLALCKIVDSK